MNQRGMAPLLIPIGIAALIIIGGSIFYAVNRNNEVDPAIPAMIMPSDETPASSSATLPVAPSFKPATKPAVKPSASVTPKPTSSSTASSTPNPSQNASSQPAKTPEPTPTTGPKVTCGVHFDPTSGTAPVDVKLIYSASFTHSNGDYVTNVQWDWDGDGNWDTDLSPNNQHTTHNYGSAGSYNVKMRLETQNGLKSDVCSNSITIE